MLAGEQHQVAERVERGSRGRRRRLTGRRAARIGNNSARSEFPVSAARREGIARAIGDPASALVPPTLGLIDDFPATGDWSGNGSPGASGRRLAAAIAVRLARAAAANRNAASYRPHITHQIQASFRRFDSGRQLRPK